MSWCDKSWSRHLLCVEPKSNTSWAILALRDSSRNGFWFKTGLSQFMFWIKIEHDALTGCQNLIDTISGVSIWSRLNGTWLYTSYGSFFLTANEGIVPSFWVSAQWKIFWYSSGSVSWAGILTSCIRELFRGSEVLTGRTVWKYDFGYITYSHVGFTHIFLQEMSAHDGVSKWCNGNPPSCTSVNQWLPRTAEVATRSHRL